MKCGIYKITNIVNGMVYIGQSVEIETRWKRHKLLLTRGNHYNLYIQRAWDKYGANNFKFEIVELCERKNLNEREHYWWEQYKPNVYNLGATGNYPNSVSEATREKKRKAMLGKKWSEEHKKKSSIALKEYYKNNPKACELNRIHNLGRIVTKEQRNKISKSLKAHFKKHPMPAQARENMGRAHRKNKVILNNSIVFNSVKECAEYLGVKEHSLINTINGWRKDIKGYKASYWR